MASRPRGGSPEDRGKGGKMETSTSWRWRLHWTDADGAQSEVFSSRTAMDEKISRLSGQGISHRIENLK